MGNRLIRRGAIAGLTLVGIEVAYALLRPTPRLDDFDPSGEFGDPSHPTLRVVVMGDSSVTAPGVAGPHETWIAAVCSRLSEDRHVLLRSLAVGGSMAHDLLEGQLKDAIAFEPDLVFVSVGGNDALKGIPLATFRSNLDRLIGALASTGAVVIQSGVGYLGTIPRLYPPLSSLIELRARRFDRVHRQVAAAHGTVVADQRSDDPTRWRRDRSLWAADLFHVSAAGHSRWAEVAWNAVDPLVNGSNGQD